MDQLVKVLKLPLSGADAPPYTEMDPGEIVIQVAAYMSRAIKGHHITPEPQLYMMYL